MPQGWIAQHITMQCGYGTAIMGGKQFKPGDRWHCLGCGAVDEKVIAAKTAEPKETDELTRED